MKVTVLAHTVLTHEMPESMDATRFSERLRDDALALDGVEEIDLLHEMAGRACYQSYKMPNSETATNEGYLDNIVEQGHFSVMEHGSVSFFVEDVSRALLLELERHRHISFSVESQRYVNTRTAHPKAVPPPAFDPVLSQRLQKHYERSLDEYDLAYHDLRERGLSIKEAREAARAFLPNATPVDFIVSGNVRAWRDVLYKRWHVAADAEIREFAGYLLDHLRVIAPNSVSDVPVTPYGGDTS